MFVVNDFFYKGLGAKKTKSSTRGFSLSWSQPWGDQQTNYHRLKSIKKLNKDSRNSKILKIKSNQKFQNIENLKKLSEITKWEIKRYWKRN